MKECNQCGSPMDEGELFCSMCGAKQTSEAGSQKSGVRDQESEISVSPLIKDNSEPITEQRPPSTDNQQPPTMESASGGLDSADSGIFPPDPVVVSECEDLTLYFNTSRVLMEDASFPFEFRVLPKNDKLERLKITVSGQQGMRGAGSLRRSLKMGKERELSIDVHIPPGRRGMLTFDLAVEYRTNGKPRRYECIWRAEVTPREAQCIQNLVIDIKQEQGHAGDIGGINMSGIERLAQSGNWRAVLSELAKVPPRWKELALEECGNLNSVCSFDCRGLLADPAPEARHAKLTLKTDGKKIHLISGNRLQLGRTRESDLVTRIFDEAGNMPREENLYISKFHCGFVRSGLSVKLQDGCLATDESKGKTWLNGAPVRGAVELPAGTGFLVSFGLPGGMGRIFKLKGRLLLKRQSDGSSEPTGILLERDDAVPECYLIVYDRVALKSLGPDWDGWCIARHKGGYCFGRDGHCKWLTPGSREITDSKLIEVEAFSQCGL